MRGAVRSVTPLLSIRMLERAYNFSADFGSVKFHACGQNPRA
jgi:hypothetical protein